MFWFFIQSTNIYWVSSVFSVKSNKNRGNLDSAWQIPTLGRKTLDIAAQKEERMWYALVTTHPSMTSYLNRSPFFLDLFYPLFYPTPSINTLEDRTSIRFNLDSMVWNSLDFICQEFFFLFLLKQRSYGITCSAIHIIV